MKEITPKITWHHTKGGGIAERVDRLSFIRFYRMLREKYSLTLSEASIKEIHEQIRNRGEAYIIV